MGFRGTLRIWRLLLVVALVAMPAVAARAQIVEDLSTPVPGVPGKSWLDLMGQVFTGLEASNEPNVAAKATGLVDKVHSVAGADDSWVSCRDQIKIASLEVYPLRLGGEQRLVAAPSFADKCATLVALFDDKGVLIDVINLSGDQHGGLGTNFLTPLGPAGALVTASTWHDNSSQSYDETILVLVKPDGFSSIGVVLTVGTHSCGRQFTEEAEVGTAPGTGPMRRIDAAITRETQHFGTDCETKIGRMVKMTFRGLALERQEGCLRGAYARTRPARQVEPKTGLTNPQLRERVPAKA